MSGKKPACTCSSSIWSARPSQTAGTYRNSKRHFRPAARRRWRPRWAPGAWRPQRAAAAPPERPAARGSAVWTSVSAWARGAPQGYPGVTASGRATWEGWGGANHISQGRQPHDELILQDTKRARRNHSGLLPGGGCRLFRAHALLRRRVSEAKGGHGRCIRYKHNRKSEDRFVTKPNVYSKKRFKELLLCFLPREI
jgi:hypothetical protein